MNLLQEREGKKYVIHKEGLFSRREKLTADTTNLWLYEENDAIIVGENRKYPWKLYGMFGASATSYGAIGENYILASGFGAKMAGGSWINTGEGALFQNIYIQVRISLLKLVQDYLDTVMRAVIFNGEIYGEGEKSNIKAFELKFGQGAKIRGGHLEGQK